MSVFDGTYYPHGFYTGAVVSQLFRDRWGSTDHTGPARPWMRVRVRRGVMKRSYQTWPGPEQFGQIFGRSISRQWYPNWSPATEWVDLAGVYRVDLDQSFDKNGLTVATIDVDNVAWAELAGAAGMTYHTRQRGVYWPWRGWRPPHRPGSGDAPNEWYNKLPNAQIEVWQGYGPDTAVRTFTGLIDSFGESVRPDRISITARDFGGILSDSYMFGWNKDREIPDPVTFVPRDHKFLHLGDAKTHRWVIIDDAVDIVKCVLRWAGFKQWEIEDSGVGLSVPVVRDKTMTYMDVINAVKEQLGYVFLMGEPTEDDLSIGVPIFRRASVLIPQRSKPVSIRDKHMLTDLKPQHDNKDDRHIIRVRGKVNNKLGMMINQGIGSTAAQDTFKRITFVYFPPWAWRMAGVLKALTYYNVGDNGVLGFQTERECAVACLLIAVQIGLARDTATLQTAGHPGIGLDSFAFVTDEGTGVASRLYVSNRKSTMSIGGDGTSQQKSPYGTSASSQNDLLWATELGGSLCDNGEMEEVVHQYRKVLTWPVDKDGLFIGQPIKYSGE